MPPDETPEPAPPPQGATQPPAPTPIPSSPSQNPQEDFSDPGKWFWRYIYRRFGLLGWVLVALFVPIILWIWTNWSIVKTLPKVSSLVTWFIQAPLPKADPQRFAVALAHLEYDKDQQYEHLIREALKDFEGGAAPPVRSNDLPGRGEAAGERTERPHPSATVSCRRWGRRVDLGTGAVAGEPTCPPPLLDDPARGEKGQSRISTGEF